MSNPVFFISGPPGSGKSTLARSLAQFYDSSIHIECDTLYNMVQGGHKEPWGQGAEVLMSLMYQTLIAQAKIYLRAGFAVIADYVWSPQELSTLHQHLGSEFPVHPIFLLPKKSINLERDLNREYAVGSERVVEYWDEFNAWQQQYPKLFFDNSAVSATELSQKLRAGTERTIKAWAQYVEDGL